MNSAVILDMIFYIYMVSVPLTFKSENYFFLEVKILVGQTQQDVISLSLIHI